MIGVEFKKLYSDLQVRVKEENKTDASWLMGYAQGLGNKTLTGYQFAALVDLLLVHPAVPENLIQEKNVEAQVLEEKPAAAGVAKLTLAQR